MIRGISLLSVVDILYEQMIIKVIMRLQRRLKTCRLGVHSDNTGRKKYSERRKTFIHDYLI